MKLSNIANLLNYDISGDGDFDVTGIAYAQKSKPSDVAVAFTQSDIKQTSAQCILTNPVIDFTPKTLLFTHESIFSALVRIAKLFIQEGVYQDFSDTSIAYSAQIGKFLAKDVQIGSGSMFEPGVVVHNGVRVGRNCHIGSNSVIYSGVTIGDQVVIGANSCIGANALFRYSTNGKLNLFCGIGQVYVGNNVSIGNNVNIQRGVLSNTDIGDNSIIGNLIDIAHDVTIGENSFICSQAGIAGNASIGNNVTLFGQTGVVNNIRVGNNAVVYAKTLVTKNVGESQTVSGIFSLKHKDDMRIIAEMRCRLHKEK